MSGQHSAKKEKLVEFFAGIDGGGTRTSVLVESSDRSMSDKKVFPAFNFNSIGEAAFRSLVREILSWLETFGPCLKLCIGAAGISSYTTCRFRSVISPDFSSSLSTAYRCASRLLSNVMPSNTVFFALYLLYGINTTPLLLSARRPRKTRRSQSCFRPDLRQTSPICPTVPHFCKPLSSLSWGSCRPSSPLPRKNR